MNAIISDAVEEFSVRGAATMDGPFSKRQIEAAASLFDQLLPFRDPGTDDYRRHRVQRTNDFFHPQLLELIQHPFMEEGARGMLNAEAVEFFASTMARTFAQPGSKFQNWLHVDVKYTTADLDASPRRMICGCCIWLCDVTMDCAPLMFSPGSHRLIAAHMDRDPKYIDNPVGMEALPPLEFAAPVPILARAGQVTFCTTAAIHGASSNTGMRDRKVLFVNFVPKGVPVRANMDWADERRFYLAALREYFRPERRHLLP